MSINNDMYKTCRYCRFYTSGGCSKIALMQTNATIGGEIYNIFESGELSDFITENLNIDNILEILIEELKEQSLIRKNKKIDKDSFQIENYITEALDNTVSNFLISKIKDIKEDIYNTIEVDPDFYCKYFE